MPGIEALLETVTERAYTRAQRIRNDDFSNEIMADWRELDEATRVDLKSEFLPFVSLVREEIMEALALKCAEFFIEQESIAQDQIVCDRQAEVHNNAIEQIIGFLQLSSRISTQ